MTELQIQQITGLDTRQVKPPANVTGLHQADVELGHPHRCQLGKASQSPPAAGAETSRYDDRFELMAFGYSWPQVLDMWKARQTPKPKAA